MSAVVVADTTSASVSCLSLLWFFFSSRRRHTRWPRDWSSDVCSSDLRAQGPAPGAGGHQRAGPECLVPGVVAGGGRSEERRVGKECRSRWAWDDGKKEKRAKRTVVIQRP